MWFLSVLHIFISVHFITGSFYDYKYGYGYVSDGEKSSEWPGSLFSSGRMSQPKCIDIPKNLTLCQKIGYDKMRIPNLLQHDSINEVIQQSKSWISLLGVHCHADTKLFLCSLFSPVCLERDREIYPCRSLCESVKNGCESTMRFYGYGWPDMVRCDKFPEESEMCIRGLTTSTEPSMYNKPERLCSACNQPNTFEGLIHNYCRSSFVIKAKIKKSRIRNGNTMIYLKKKRKVVKGSLSKKERRSFFKSPYIEGGGTCECDLLSPNKTKKSFIVMGNKTDTGGFTVTFLAQWGRDKGFRKAIRMMKKGVACNDDIIVLGQPDNTLSGGKSKGKGKGRKKGKGNKRKNKGRRKNKKGGKGRKRKNKKDKKDKKDKNTVSP